MKLNNKQNFLIKTFYITIYGRSFNRSRKKIWNGNKYDQDKS